MGKNSGASETVRTTTNERASSRTVYAACEIDNEEVPINNSMCKQKLANASMPKTKFVNMGSRKKITFHVHI